MRMIGLLSLVFSIISQASTLDLSRCPNITFDEYPTGLYSQLTHRTDCGVTLTLMGVGGRFGIQPIGISGGEFLAQSLTTAAEVCNGKRPFIRVIFDKPVQSVSVIQANSIGYEN